MKQAVLDSANMLLVPQIYDKVSEISNFLRCILLDKLRICYFFMLENIYLLSSEGE